MRQDTNQASTGQGMNDTARRNNESTRAARAKNRIGIRWMVFVAALLLLAPAFGLAQSGDTQDSGQGFVDRFDQDGDGTVSEDEFPGPDEHFSELDSDGDGYIDDAEAPQGRPNGGRGGFERDDQDNDGRVSQDEFSGPSDHFDRMDQNQDGYIDEDEASQGRRGGGGGHGGGGGGQGRGN